MKETAAAALAGLALVGGGIAVVGGLENDATPSFDPATQYLGACGDVVTPPTPGACEAIQGMIRYGMLGALVNAKPFQNWRKGAPVDAARLDAFLATPTCPNVVSSPTPTPHTFMGQAVANMIQAYACAKGTGPLTWPAPNPPPVAGSTDTTPPTPPSGLQVSPGG